MHAGEVCFQINTQYLGRNWDACWCTRTTQCPTRTVAHMRGRTPGFSLTSLLCRGDSRWGRDFRIRVRSPSQDRYWQGRAEMEGNPLNAPPSCERPCPLQQSSLIMAVLCFAGNREACQYYWLFTQTKLSQGIGMGKRKWLSFISFHWPLMCSQEQDMPIGPRQMEALQLKGVSVLLRELLLHEEPKMTAISVTQPNVSLLFISPAFIGRRGGTER